MKPTTNEFAKARALMGHELATDEGLMMSYQANIAMLLNDRYGFGPHKKRNRAAQDILQLVFPIPAKAKTADKTAS